MQSKFVVILVTWISFFALAAEVYCQQRSSDSPIILGQTCALSGPARNLGIELRAGLQAAFEEANLSGGINGREIVLISKDDGYEPYRAVANVRELIEEENVFMLIGGVGTPTSKAVVPLAEKARIPFFAPLSGAELLREPFRKYVINIRASYYQEMEKIVSHLVGTLKLKRIACFYQNDSFGHSGLSGIQHALATRGLELVSTGTYERNTVAVLGGLNDIHRGRPEAIVLVGAYPACGEFIKLSKLRIARDIVFANISFVGTRSLQKALGDFGENVIVSQVVPFPMDTNLQLVQDYLKALKRFRPNEPPGFTSLEGYIAGRLFCAVAQKVRGEMTRELFISTLENTGRFDLGGVKLKFSPNDHQGTDEIYLTKFSPTPEVIQ